MAHKWSAIRKQLSPEREARIAEQIKHEMQRLSLCQLREARNLTQASLADVLQVPQSAVSKMERRADMYVSTLRSYIKAMGGNLEIKAVFPDAEISIDQFQEIEDRKRRPQHITARSAQSSQNTR